MLISVTRLHVRHWWILPAFALHTYRSMRQAKQSAGFLGGRLAGEPPLGFWTITVWNDEQAMRGFRNTAAHLKAMPRLLDWCDEASYAHWQQQDSAVPSWSDAFHQLRTTGKVSKVRHPSARHSAGMTVANAPPTGGGTILQPR